MSAHDSLFPDGRPVDEWLDDDDRAVIREETTSSLFSSLGRNCRLKGWFCIECWKARFKYRVWRIYE